MAKPLFTQPQPPMPGLSPADRNQGLPDQVLRDRYAIYIEEAQSGKHLSQKSALNATSVRLGMSRNDARLRQQFKKLGMPLVDLKMPELVVEDASTIEDHLRQQLADAQVYIDRQKALLSREQGVRKALQNQIWAREREDEIVAEAEGQRFNPFTIAPNLHAPSSPGFPMTIWSDIHCGEEIKLRDMAGLNAFNRDIMYERAEKLVAGTIKLWRNYGGMRPEYPGVWINFGGDMISGGIHEELRETNWGTIEEQAVDIGECLISCLLAMAGEFADDHRKIYVPCVVGNHGRRSLKPVAKQHVRENREWGIYRAIAAQLADDKRFEFFIPDTPDFHYEVYGHKFMLTHGNQIGARGGDGHIGAVGPITRGSMKTNWQQMQIKLGFDTMVIGHYHAYSPRGVLVPVIVNGCWKGFDEYAMNVLRVPFSKPQQAVWFVSPSHGIVNQTSVSLL
jgi:hypothetical protein